MVVKIVELQPTTALLLRLGGKDESESEAEPQLTSQVETSDTCNT